MIPPDDPYSIDKSHNIPLAVVENNLSIDLNNELRVNSDIQSLEILDDLFKPNTKELENRDAGGLIIEAPIIDLASTNHIEKSCDFKKIVRIENGKN